MPDEEVNPESAQLLPIRGPRFRQPALCVCQLGLLRAFRVEGSTYQVLCSLHCETRTSVGRSHASGSGLVGLKYCPFCLCGADLGWSVRIGRMARTKAPRILLDISWLAPSAPYDGLDIFLYQQTG